MTMTSIKGEWLDSPQSKALFKAFQSAGHEVRFVGGVVRNALLGEPVSDLDMATDARPDEVMELAQGAGFKAIGTGLDHGTVTVVIDHVVYEITTLRLDVETHGRHATIAYTTDWREDAARRDFTMNALYADGEGVIFDPLGGLADLQARRVRFIGHAGDRIREDYLRILRFFRFSAQYGEGQVDAEGLASCLRLRVGLAGLSHERIGAEVLRLLVTPHAADILAIMFAHGLLLPISGTVPHMARLARWLQLEATLALPPDAIDRLGALCVLVPEDAARLADRLRLSNEQQYRLALWGRRASFSPQLSRRKARRLCHQLGDEYRPLVLIDWLKSHDCSADPRWRGLFELVDDWQPPAFPLKGRDLLGQGFAAGPALGRHLRVLEEDWIDSDFTLTRDDLLARLP